MPKLSTSDAIVANALALARMLNVPDREIARSALTLALTLAEKTGDPDGFLAKLVPYQMKDRKHGR